MNRMHPDNQYLFVTGRIAEERRWAREERLARQARTERVPRVEKVRAEQGGGWSLRHLLGRLATAH